MDVISRAPDVNFEDTFPSPSASKMRKLGDRVRCKQCGFPIDPSKTGPGSGYGNLVTTTISGETAYTDDDGNTFYRTLDPITKAGCPLCNSSNWK